MSEELKPCPFCGASVTAQETDDGPVRPVSVICGECGASSDIHNTADEAIAAWNRRAPMTAPTPAGEENVTENIAAFCDACAESSERHLFVDRAKAFRSAAQSIRSGLLSSPRVGEVRREAFEEAAARLEVLAIDYEERADVSAADKHYSTAAYQKREADTLLIAATLIRSLSPTEE